MSNEMATLLRSYIKIEEKHQELDKTHVILRSKSIKL